MKINDLQLAISADKKSAFTVKTLSCNAVRSLHIDAVRTFTAPYREA
jgi:hypothetical protein